MMFKYFYKVLAKAENEAYNSAISTKYAKRSFLYNSNIGNSKKEG